MHTALLYIITFRPKQNYHFADENFKFILVSENGQIWIIFHWRLLLGFELTIFQICFIQATSHYLSQWWLVYWRLNALLCLNEIFHWMYAICSCGSRWYSYNSTVIIWQPSSRCQPAKYTQYCSKFSWLHFLDKNGCGVEIVWPFVLYT